MPPPAGRDVVAGLRGDPVPLSPLDLDQDQAAQVGPEAVGGHVPDVLRCPDDPAAARLDAAVVLVHGLVEVVVAAREGFRLLDREGLDHRLVPRRLVVLERQHIVGAPVAEGLRNPRVAAHGVDGHDAALEHQHLEQCRHGRNLVGLVGHPTLAQDQARLVRPGTHQMQGRHPPDGVAGAAGHLAVHRHNLVLEVLRQRPYPARKADPGCWGSSRAKTRPKVSCEGIPCGRARNVSSQACFWWPKNSTSVQLSAPQMTTSREWCRA